MIPSTHFFNTSLACFALRSSMQLSGPRWRIRDSNPRPSACKADALPAELIPQQEKAPEPAKRCLGRAGGRRRSVPQDRIAEIARRQKMRLTGMDSDSRPETSLQKGGDPTAGSPTVTLLRLHPSYQSLFRRLPHEVGAPTSRATDSHGVTGGVYKARERIHRSLLICDY